MEPQNGSGNGTKESNLLINFEPHPYGGRERPQPRRPSAAPQPKGSLDLSPAWEIGPTKIMAILLVVLENHPKNRYPSKKKAPKQKHAFMAV